MADLDSGLPANLRGFELRILRSLTRHNAGIFNRPIPPAGAVVSVAYSLAKDLEEEMTRQYWSQKMIGLRFSNVVRVRMPIRVRPRSPATPE